MKAILLFLLLGATGGAFADTDPRENLKQLEAELNDVRQEQQSVYQSYQMVKELRLMNVQEGLSPRPQYPHGMGINTPPPNYDDVVRAQLERERSIQQYSDDLKRLSVRYLELETQRKLLQERIRESRLQPAE